MNRQNIVLLIVTGQRQRKTDESRDRISIRDETVHVYWADGQPLSNVWLHLPCDRNEGILGTEQGRRHKEITSCVRNNALSHLCLLQYTTEGTNGEQRIRPVVWQFWWNLSILQAADQYEKLLQGSGPWMTYSSPSGNFPDWVHHSSLGQQSRMRWRMAKGASVPSLTLWREPKLLWLSLALVWDEFHLMRCELIPIVLFSLYQRFALNKKRASHSSTDTGDEQ